MKAIILLAGDGSRMGSFCRGVPKCLLELEKKKTILEYQLKNLGSHNINEIVLVLGFKKDLIKKKIEVLPELRGKKIMIYFNPLYKITENAFSLWASRESFNNDLIIINGDILFSKEALVDLIRDENTYSLLVEKKKCDKEDQKVKVKNNLIFRVGKNLPLKEAYGEVMGMGKIKKEGLNLFKDVLFEGVKENPRIYWPEIFNYLIKKNCKVHKVLTSGFYSDLDTKKDYLRLKRILKDRSILNNN